MTHEIHQNCLRLPQNCLRKFNLSTFGYGTSSGWVIVTWRWSLRFGYWIWWHYLDLRTQIFGYKCSLYTTGWFVPLCAETVCLVQKKHNNIFLNYEHNKRAKLVRKTAAKTCQTAIPARAYRRWAGHANPNVQSRAFFIKRAEILQTGKIETRSGRHFCPFEDLIASLCFAHPAATILANMSWSNFHCLETFPNRVLFNQCLI